jgi:AraC-like DNA-binding protein
MPAPRRSADPLGHPEAPPLRDGVAMALADTLVRDALFDSLPFVVFFVKDDTARYLAVNEALVARCRAGSKIDLLGRRASEVFQSSFGREYEAQDHRVLTLGQALRGRLELHPLRDGSLGWCVTDKFPLRAAGGRVIGLVGVSRDVPAAQFSHGALEALAQALELARGGLAEPLRVNELCARVGLSTARFTRLVTRLFGITPRQLVQRLRIEEAAMRLAHTEASIFEVAIDCGYADQSAFTRAFRANTGRTPLAFRAALRSSVEDGAGDEDAMRSRRR